MDQEEIYIIHLQFPERLFERLRDIVGMFTIVPELGRYEKLLSRNSGPFNRSSYMFLCPVSAGALACGETKEPNTNMTAVSICRYPTLMASTTASSCAFSSCQVPNPIPGISAPVFSLNRELGILDLLDIF